MKVRGEGLDLANDIEKASNVRVRDKETPGNVRLKKGRPQSIYSQGEEIRTQGEETRTQLYEEASYATCFTHWWARLAQVLLLASAHHDGEIRGKLDRAFQGLGGDPRPRSNQLLNSGELEVEAIQYNSTLRTALELNPWVGWDGMGWGSSIICFDHVYSMSPQPDAEALYDPMTK
jgi:hypothetical protein